MTVYVNGSPKTITLRPWLGDQWGPCCFADLETGIRDGQDLTQLEYDAIVRYWADEVSRYNAGDITESLGDPDENYTREFGFWAD